MNLLLLSSIGSQAKLILLDEILETTIIETNLTWAKDSGTEWMEFEMYSNRGGIAVIQNKGINVWSRARDLPETRGGLRVYGRVIDGSKVRGMFTRFRSQGIGGSVR